MTSKFFNKFLGQKITKQHAQEIFAAFDANKDNLLDKSELQSLLGSLATDNDMSSDQFNKIFAFLDSDRDGLVSSREFLANAVPWLNVVLAAPAALLVVDVQNDFIDGSLALKNYPAGEDGLDVVPVVNRIVESLESAFALIVYSLDWHPQNHISFAANIANRLISDKSQIRRHEEVKEGDTVVLETQSYGAVEQYMWPVHCVQNSDGAKLHPQLKLPAKHIKIYKGTDPDIDSYSAFWDNGKRKETDLRKTLASAGVLDVILCGLATDVCVGSTSAHSQELGFRTALVQDASRGVMPDGISETKRKLRQENGIVIDADHVESLVKKTRRPSAWLAAAVDTVEKRLRE